MPRLELDHTVTPSPVNPLGVKGCGEAGTIGSAAVPGERGLRCARAARDRAHRQAADAGAGVGRHPGGARRRRTGHGWSDPTAVRVRARRRRCGTPSTCSRAGRRDQGHGRRPQPAADDEVPAGAAAAGCWTSRGLAELRGRRGIPEGRPDRRRDHLPRAAREPSSCGSGSRSSSSAPRTSATVQVRNRGTIGGSLAHADPASRHAVGDAGARRDLQRPLEARAAGGQGTRVLPGSVRDRARRGRAAARHRAAGAAQGRGHRVPEPGPGRLGVRAGGRRGGRGPERGRPSVTPSSR